MADVMLSADDLIALKNEVKLSEKLLEADLLPRLAESIERYTGRFVPIVASNWSILLNEIYPVVQYMLPTIFFRNPRVFLKPRNKFFLAKRRNPVSGEVETIQLLSEASAKTQQAILNYEMEQMRFKQEVRKVLADALMFPYGVLWHGYKGNFGMTSEQSLYIRDESIYVMRISPRNFIYDPSVSAENLDKARWVGRQFYVRLIDALEDDRLDVDKKQLRGVVGYGEKVGKVELKTTNIGGADVIHLGDTRKSLIEYSDKQFQGLPHARFLKFSELFIRPTPKEEREDKSGKVVLLCFEQTKPLRASRWEYKAQGFPAKLLQLNPVPDERFGLADFEVYGSIADHKNLVVNQQIRNAEQLNRTVVGVSKADADEEDIQKLKAGTNSIVAFDTDDVKKRMFVAPMGGGASNELYLLDQRIDKNLQDKSGVSDLKRGFLQSGEESAASVKLRAAGSSARPAYRQDLMADFLRESCLYLNELLKQYLPVEDAVRIVGSLDVQWSDKPTKEEIQADVDVELDVQSMLPESPEREIQELTTILNLMVEALSNPQVYQKIQQEGKTFNLGPIIENLLVRLKIRNPDVFRNIKPEESEGFVEVAELRAAQQNIQASLQGQPPPSPPAPGQNHRARLEMYAAVAALLQEMQVVSDQLNALIQLQVALLQAEEEKESGRMAQPSRNGSRIQVAQPVGAG